MTRTPRKRRRHHEPTVGGPGPIGRMTLDEIDAALKAGRLSDAAVLAHPTLDPDDELEVLAKFRGYGSLRIDQVAAEKKRRGQANAQQRARANAPLPRRAPARDLSLLTRDQLREFEDRGALSPADVAGEIARRRRVEHAQATVELEATLKTAATVRAMVSDLDDDQVVALYRRGDLSREAAQHELQRRGAATRGLYSDEAMLVRQLPSPSELAAKAAATRSLALLDNIGVFQRLLQSPDDQDVRAEALRRGLPMVTR